MTKKPEKVDTEELRAALNDVGMLMRLPPKEPTAEEIAAAAKAAAPSAGIDLSAITSRVSLKFMPVLAVIVVIGASVWKFWPQAEVVVPEALVREWTCTHANFAGRRLAFTADSIFLAVQPGAPMIGYKITDLKQTRKADSTIVLVSYDDAGGIMELEASLSLLPAPRLVFRRPEGLVWEPLPARRQ
jgi:hypothetical protein